MGSPGVWERFEKNSQGLLDIVSNELKADKTRKTVMEGLLENFLAKTTNESGFGYQNMSAVLITLK
jgi:hypothetical protein